MLLQSLWNGKLVMKDQYAASDYTDAHPEDIRRRKA
jgi:hypothetical protein